MRAAADRRGTVEAALGAGWIAFGAAVAIAAWRMERLQHLAIEPYSAPGVLPGVLGVAIVAFGIALLVRGLRMRRASDAGTAAPEGPGSKAAAADTSAAAALPPLSAAESATALPAADSGGLRRAVAAAALCIVFAGGLLGRGLPFTALAAAFIFAFILMFRPHGAARTGLTGIASAAAIAVAGAWALAWLFGTVFLVRLP